ncbi:hypothetical protein [Melittangium boletus]|uniref:Uncharacterized protein n=1 Tax=Melittangium boletus DSM 14713 TaxID=1294270 RepID=A0A250I897_9BACT|nr:hypothetical protein [Melittangium boletus]ATB28094.1 hypothetical protein MEBOL_001539 [Melittangium boletus DSM 14713]
MGVLVVLGITLSAYAQPPSSRLPGRKSESAEPWGAFLGRAAHDAIGRQYRIQHPTNLIFLGTIDLSTIIREGKLGDPNRLSALVKRLRPDITDTDALVLFEVKPDNEVGRRMGREQAGRYLAALNAAIEPNKHLSGGTHFDGSLFIEFEGGGALWQLAWRTPEPGVTLYRWSSRRPKPNTSWQERAAQKEEQLSQEEVEKRGELAERVLRAAYEGSEWPSGFRGQVYLPVDCP